LLAGFVRLMVDNMQTLHGKLNIMRYTICGMEQRQDSR